MSNNSKFMPKLRFPEFRTEPGWEKQTISSLLNKVAKPVAVESNEMYREIGIRSHGKGIFHKEPISGSAIADKRVFWVVQDAFVVNVVFAWEQAVTTTSQAEVGMIASHRFPMYVSKQGKCDVRFIARIFQSKKGKHLLGLASPGGAGRNRTLGQKEFEKLEIIVPNKVEEQQKIADCLSSLDELIAAEGRKLESLRTYKKGLMQQLFPSDGETTPRLRFPEFRKRPGWKLMPLMQLLLRRPEYGLNAAAVPFSASLPTYVRITDIDDDCRFTSKCKVSVDADVDEEDYLLDGDIVLARTGASVGKSYRYRVHDGRLVFAGFLIRIRPDVNKVIPELIANYFTTRQYWDWVRSTSSRSGEPGINGSEYATLPIPLPSSDNDDNGLAEQKMIADCLCSFDDKITAQSRKLDALRAHKKGLVQQLFPSAVEV